MDFGEADGRPFKKRRFFVDEEEHQTTRIIDSTPTTLDASIPSLAQKEDEHVNGGAQCDVAKGTRRAGWGVDRCWMSEREHLTDTFE